MPSIKDQLSKRVRDTLEKLLKSDSIDRYVTQRIERSVDVIAARALGFRSDGWGRWEADIHSKSTFSQLMQQCAQAAVERIIRPVLETTETKIKPATLKEIKRAANDAYSQRLRDLCRERAATVGRERAEIDAGRLMEDLLAKDIPEITATDVAGED